MADGRAPLWIFGYGSLIWRPDYPYAECGQATIEGWSRRFWQGSTDHRGVPGAPGRVVTLAPEPAAICWGKAYRIGESDREAVLAHLDHREKGGYALEPVTLLLTEKSARIDGFVYIATPDNPNYIGPADEADIARVVLKSRGPSGPNDEYVLRLAAALRDMKAADPHVFAVERHLRRLMAAD
jgi:glutathione-specific gamma-glutamylcyclotransferase